MNLFQNIKSFIKYNFLMRMTPKGIKDAPENSSQSSSTSFYDLRMTSIDGIEVQFQRYQGKHVLIVNTASECGYTPQFEALQKLHKLYGNKLAVLGFPANNFGAQEPGSNEDIANFCVKNFKVSFQLFDKSDVTGPNKNEVYQWLSNKKQNGWNTQEPTWNFCKYLINDKGRLINYYSPSVDPLSGTIVEVVGQR